MKSHLFYLDFHEDTLFYQIDEMKTPAMSIGNIFYLFETSKDILNLETYSLSQTTLEQVFMTFAKNQANAQPSSPQQQPGATSVAIPVVFKNGIIQIS